MVKPTTQPDLWIDAEPAPRVRAYGNRSSFPIRVGWTLAVIALLWGLFGELRHALAIRAQIQSTTGEMSRLALSGATKPAERALSFRLTEQQTRELNRVVAQLDTPWQDILLTLENTTPPDVAIIAVEPRPGVQTIRVVAESRTIERLIGYSTSLRNQGVFGALDYQKHETNTQDPNAPVRLTFDLEVRPRIASKSAPSRATSPP